MGLDGWRSLRSGSGGTILCVDFTLAKVRAQANFADLAPLLPDGYAVWSTDETAWPTSAGAPRDQLTDWLDRSGTHFGDLGSRSGTFGGAPVRAVLGFCGAASLAATLASVTGTAPQVILFNPVTVDAATMVNQFDASLRKMAVAAGESALAGARAGLPSAGDRAGLPSGGDPAGLPSGGDVGALATLLTERYAALAGPACAAQGVPPSIVGQLCQRVETNLRYLALCATARIDAAPAALLMLSRDHAGSPEQLRGTPETRVDTTQNELLSHPEAARAVAGALAGKLAAGR